MHGSFIYVYMGIKVLLGSLKNLSPFEISVVSENRQLTYVCCISQENGTVCICVTSLLLAAVGEQKFIPLEEIHLLEEIHW